MAVEHNAFRRQARSLMPEARLGRLPTARTYGSARRLAGRVRDKLVEAGEAPVDLLDVRAFVWETLRPKAVEQLARLEQA